MRDSRFAVCFDDLEGLFKGADVDDVSDLDTLLMLVFARPMRVNETREGGAEAVEVIALSDDEMIGLICVFPMSVMQLVRNSALMVDELGPYTHGVDVSSRSHEDVMTMDDTALVSALQRALGMVRLSRLLDAGPTVGAR